MTLCGPGQWWRSKSTPAKAETYTRWSFHSFAGTGVVPFGLPMLAKVRMPAAAWLTALLGGHLLLCAVTGSRALAWHRGLREQPRRLMWALAVVSAVLACGGLVLGPRAPGGEDAERVVMTAFVGALVLGVGVVSLGVRGRRLVLYLTTGCGAGAALAVFVLRGSAPPRPSPDSASSRAPPSSRSPPSCPSGRSTPSTNSTRPARPGPGSPSPRNGCGSGATCTM